MDLRQLNTFVTIAKLQSFTQAAEILGYAQSTITTQIQLLEKELETKLFERLGRNISLTSEGQKLLPYAKQILRLSSEAKSAVSSSDIPKGTLTIGAVESLCIVRLPELLKEYRKRYPEVEISLKFGSSSDFYRYLRDNTIDIAFFLDRKIESEDLISEIHFQEPMTLLTAPGHPLALKEKVLPGDLDNEPFILTETGCCYRAAFENIINRYGVQLRSVLETGSVQAIKQLAMSGLGITLLPKVAVEEELAQNRLLSLKWGGPEIEIFTQVIYHKDKWISAPLNAFLELVREMLP
ncbi:MAG: LysR family transcriptional regulator [Clostridia bacterium]|nr:LysR family transcriptional regulator [Clostridia bacterium]